VSVLGKNMKLLIRCVGIIAGMAIFSCLAFIPFNPIINPSNGNPLTTKTVDTVGWLDVPAHDKIPFNRVLALKDDNNQIHYLHPTGVILPKGLFCWQSDWQDYAKNFLGKNKAYNGLADDFEFLTQEIKKHNRTAAHIGVRNQPNNSPFFVLDTPKKKWIHYNEQNETTTTWDPTQQKYNHPSIQTSLFFTWNTEDENKKRLFRPWFFYQAMGVTEEYFREFFGNDRKELLKPIDDRDPKKVALPSNEAVARAFPLDSSYFPNRKKFLYVAAHSKIVTIENLQKEVEKNAQKKVPSIKLSKKKPQITIIDGYQIYAKNNNAQAAQEQTSIQYLMGKKEFNDAVIGAASNFDGLEGGMSKERNPAALLEGMQWTPTQGEEVAISAPANAILLKYYENSLNMLENLTKKINVKEGEISAIDQPLTDDDIPNIAIILRDDVPVASSYYSPISRTQTNKDFNTRIEYLNKNHIISRQRDPISIFNKLGPDDIKINLVLASAVDLKGHKGDTTYEKTAKVILEAMYRGILLTAVACKKEKVILPLLGAGSFENKLKWIGDILQSNKIAKIIIQGGLHVYIPIFPDFRKGRGFKPEELEKFRQALDTLSTKIANGNERNDNAQKGAIINKVKNQQESQKSKKPTPSPESKTESKKPNIKQTPPVSPFWYQRAINYLRSFFGNWL
jgi:hypothetical protein